MQKFCQLGRETAGETAEYSLDIPSHGAGGPDDIGGRHDETGESFNFKKTCSRDSNPGPSGDSATGGDRF